MELLTFKTLWGHSDIQDIKSLETACGKAMDNGFAGIEGPIPASEEATEQFAMLLEKNNLRFIAEICTAGSYVPNRRASVQQHLEDLAAQLNRIYPLQPMLVNCIGGCDRWSVDDSVHFFQQALKLADKAGIAISFETHRGRSLYSPWVAEQILSRINLPLTCDFSHWCVVCEGLGESEDDLLREVARHARHIHGRIGYDQGPQVSDPQSFLYWDDLQKHLRWWCWIWQAQILQGKEHSTFTPEFGPDGYQMRNPHDGAPVGDLDSINHWMARLCHHEFTKMEDEIQKTRDGLVPSPISRSNISPAL